MNKRYLLAGGLLVLGVTTEILGCCRMRHDPAPDAAERSPHTHGVSAT